MPLLELTRFSALAISFHNYMPSRLDRRRTDETITTICSIRISTSHDERNVFLFLVSDCPGILQYDVTSCGTPEIVFAVFGR